MSQDKSIISFFNNSENTMSSELNSSVGTVLVKLAGRYGRSSNPEILISEERINACLKELDEKIASQPDETLHLAWAHLKNRMNEEPDGFDRVTYWEDGVEITRLIEIKSTLAIVYSALTDKEIFKGESEADALERYQTLYNNIKSNYLDSKSVCHQGVRHNLTFSLMGVYPSVWFVEDFLMFLNNMISDYLLTLLEEIRGHSRILMYSKELPKTREKNVLYLLKTNQNTIQVYPFFNTDEFKTLGPEASQQLYAIKDLPKFPENKPNEFVEISSTICPDLVNQIISICGIIKNDSNLYLQVLFAEINHQRHPALEKLINKKELTLRIEKQCSEYGINHQSIKYAERIQSYVNSIGEAELPFGSNLTIHCVKSILTSKANDNTQEIRVKALFYLKKWIHENFQLGNDAHKNHVESFSGVEDAYALFKKYAALLRCWNHSKISPEEIDRLSNLFDDYYQGCMENKINVVSTEFAKAVKKFKEICEEYKQDVRQDWVENFFANWNTILSGSRIDEGKRLYAQLLNPVLQAKYQVDDNFLKDLFNPHKEEVSLETYLINRIFLHAITVKPEEWTTLFAVCFGRVYEFVSKGFHQEDDPTRIAALQISYSEGLMKQLAYLQSRYHQSTETESEVAEIDDDDATYIPMLHLTKNANVLIFVVSTLPENERMSFIQGLGNDFIRDTAEWNESTIKDLFGELPEIHWANFLNLLGRDLLKNTINFHDFLAFCSISNHKIDFISGIEKEILKEIFKDGRNVQQMLFNLAENERMPFLETLGEVFLNQMLEKEIELYEKPNVDTTPQIGSGTELWLRLRQLPENQRVGFLEKLGTDWLKKIANPTELWCVLAHLPKAQLPNFLEKLGVDAFKPLINNADSLIKLRSLFPENFRKSLENHCQIICVQAILERRNSNSSNFSWTISYAEIKASNVYSPLLKDTIIPPSIIIYASLKDSGIGLRHNYQQLGFRSLEAAMEKFRADALLDSGLEAIKLDNFVAKIIASDPISTTFKLDDLRVAWEELTRTSPEKGLKF
jgi:hypothetical protein